MNLHDGLIQSARRHPDWVAVEETGGATYTYRQLDEASDRLRDRLVSLGVSAGDRVGLCLHKSIDSVVGIFGALKAGAAYVPVDAGGPLVRNAYVFHHCSVKVAIVEPSMKPDLERELSALGHQPVLLALRSGGGEGMAQLLSAGPEQLGGPPREEHASAESLAYVLYTSGSTGAPKGVMVSHASAVHFVKWCLEAFTLTASDRVSSHAPFHFDLSIFDIYVPIACGARVVLISEALGKEPVGLARWISEKRISVWYSAPSILAMLARFGHLTNYDCSALRAILFAGEVFPVAHLRRLCGQLSRPRYFNLYGPTETNVCTYYEVPTPIPESRIDPYPIGRVCPGLDSRVLDLAGAEAQPGAEGELCIAGPTVMRGYWNSPEQTALAFLEGGKFYRTGDVVVRELDGILRFVGRRDRLIKRRGFRVELGEIETCLYGHPRVKEAAVLATPDGDMNLLLSAHLSLDGADRLSLIELKTFCSTRLPVYMIPDTFAFHPQLPKTSTAKIDYRYLANLK